MISKSFQIMALVLVVAISITTASVAFVTAETVEKTAPKKESLTPRYSETCAHGHNGFDCKLPSYRVDISDLQEKVTALEKRVSRP